MIATIDALGKSGGIQNLKITDLCGHLLFDSSMDRHCLQEWMTHMMKTLPLQKCITKTLPLQECLYTTSLPLLQQMQMITRMQNLITMLLTPMRLTTIQAKHPYTALEATYPFTVPLVNHHNILQMRKTILPKIKLTQPM